MQPKAKAKVLQALALAPAASPPAASHSSSAKPLSSSYSSKKPNKFKFLMTYMFEQCCASAQCEHDMQERFYHFEQ